MVSVTRGTKVEMAHLRVIAYSDWTYAQLGHKDYEYAVWRDIYSVLLTEASRDHEV